MQTEKPDEPKEPAKSPPKPLSQDDLANDLFSQGVTACNGLVLVYVLPDS